MKKRILDTINSPEVLKLLNNRELTTLAQEIREEIIQTTSQTGGHVASSLGAVDLIVAVHSLINSPKDKFIFDVGHQSYAHMLLTGRKDEFKTLRQYEGLSGFPKPSSNPHDVHPSGHASDSLSVACGLARARDLDGGNNKIVALIGDASLGGGMAFEALNDIGQAQTPLVIILNDNEMSISHNVGAMAYHLGQVRTTSHYRRNRDLLQDFMETRVPGGKALVYLGKSAKESVKQFVLPEGMLFENLGIVCTPPVDGHNIALLREVIGHALTLNYPVLVHVVTKKGIGYKPAEDNPSKFHGVGPYEISTGKPKKKASDILTYTQAFGTSLIKEAKEDKNIVAITAAMTDGTGLAEFGKEFPKRLFDVGIAEGHAVGMASGLATGGKKPVVCLYSTFLQRAFDQAIINCALPKFNVVFAIDRGGLVGDDGPTHHGVFDIAYMRMIPNMKVLAPCDEAELACALHTALKLEGPVSLRYPRGEAAGTPLPDNPEMLEVGKSRLLKEGSDVAILSFGRMTLNALEAASLLEKEGISVSVRDMRWIKPLDYEAIKADCAAKAVITLEEGVVKGGIGEEVASYIDQLVLDNEIDRAPFVEVMGLPDSFIPQGKVEQLFKDLGLDAEGIAQRIKACLSGS
ncbi:MAG: 1-deoxy-D-xylulose-5-phosphate synthase [Anaerotardibacter sp.]